MRQSKRLACIASMITPGGCVADIGTDHGYLLIDIVRQGLCEKAIGVDIRPGPLKKARQHIGENGLQQQISLRLGDGLSPLAPGEADTLVLTGMGGALICSILSRGEAVAKAAGECILSPQSEIDKVRKYLEESGYYIQREMMLEEDSRYYTVLKAIPGKMQYSSYLEYRYGKYLLDEKNPVLKQYLQREQKQYRELLDRLRTCEGEKIKERRSQLAFALGQVELALSLWEEIE